MKFLIVEDNHADAFLAERMVRAGVADAEIRIASSLAEGFEVAATFAPKFVFIDLKLPDMARDELAPAIRRFKAMGASVTIITGASPEEASKIVTEPVLILEKCRAFISKKDFVDEMQRGLAAVLENCATVSESTIRLRNSLENGSEKP